MTGEGIPTVERQSNVKSKLVLIGAGTATALLMAAIAFQIFRAEPAAADAKDQNTGRVRVKQDATAPRYLGRVSRNGKYAAITFNDVAAECMDRIGSEVLEAIINRTVIQLACEERNVEVNESEVNQEIIRICKDFNIPVQTWYQMLEAERNLTPVQYRRDIIWPMLALKKLAGTKITITEAEMTRAFEHRYGRKAKVRIIMFENVRRANDIWQKAQAHPEDFARLARTHSIDPNSKSLDGVVPPIPRHSGNKELEKAAFSLREGEVSGIVQIRPKRFVIMLGEGFTEPVVKHIDEVRELLWHDLEKEKVQESVARVFDKIKRETRVDNYLTNTTTGGVTQTSATRKTPSRAPGQQSRPAQPTQRSATGRKR